MLVAWGVLVRPALLIAAVTMSLAGCGDTGMSCCGTAQSASIVVATPGSLPVTRSDFGDSWPLTVDSGVLKCAGSGGVGAVTFEAGGRAYAVNGSAKSRGAQPIDPIWADDGGGQGLKKNIGALINRGLELCE